MLDGLDDEACIPVTGRKALSCLASPGNSGPKAHFRYNRAMRPHAHLPAAPKVAGTTVKQWLLKQRLLHAQRLLETSEASVERIAQAAGFGNALALRQHFRSAFRTSPSDYRKRFRPAAAA